MNKQCVIIARQTIQVAWLTLVVAVLTGCTNDDGVRAADATRTPIVFEVSSDAPSNETTRGAILNFMSGTFGLLGSSYSGNWATGHDMNFMYNEAVWGSGTEWQTSRGYFAPSSVYNLKFFAYYPYYEDIRKGDSPILMSDTTLAATPYFDYTLPQDAEEQNDLMYAISEEVKSDPLTGRLDTVRLHFHHLLTAVTVATGESTEPGIIRKVTLKNIFYQGHFDYDATTIVTSDEDVRDVWANLDLQSGGVGSGYVKADADKTFLLLPQPEAFTAPGLEVLYEAAGKTYTFKSTLSGLETALKTPGSNIVLRLTVNSLQRMSVKAVITDWDHGANFDGAVSDQPVLDLGIAISDWGENAGGQSTTSNITTGPNPTVTGYTAPTEP